MTAARARGYAVTVGEVIPSVLGISAVIPPGRRRDAISSLGISVFDSEDQAALGAEVMAAAKTLGSMLR